MRVSTGRQAESDLSIPDQRRQIAAYYVAKGWDVAAEFVEPGNTATDDRRPAFQAMIDAALVKPPTFTVIVVHAFSRFFRDQFQFEFYVRKPPAIREKFKPLLVTLDSKRFDVLVRILETPPPPGPVANDIDDAADDAAVVDPPHPMRRTPCANGTCGDSRAICRSLSKNKPPIRTFLIGDSLNHKSMQIKFDMFSSREPDSTSLENAIETD